MLMESKMFTKACLKIRRQSNDGVQGNVSSYKFTILIKV